MSNSKENPVGFLNERYIHAKEENYTAIKQKQNPVTENPDFVVSIS